MDICNDINRIGDYTAGKNVLTSQSGRYVLSRPIRDLISFSHHPNHIAAFTESSIAKGASNVSAIVKKKRACDDYDWIRALRLLENGGCDGPRTIELSPLAEFVQIPGIRHTRRSFCYWGSPCGPGIRYLSGTCG